MRFISKTGLLNVRLISEKMSHDNASGRSEQVSPAVVARFKGRAYQTKDKKIVRLMLEQVARFKNQEMNETFMVHPEDQAEADALMKSYDEETETYTPPAEVKPVQRRKPVQKEAKTQSSDDAQLT